VLPQQSLEDGPVICPFRLATGLPCPGCGLARSWVALGDGEVGTALDRHPLGPLPFVFAVAAVVAVGHRLIRGVRPVNLAGLAGSRVGVAAAAIWCTAWAGGLLL
jgi:hypothetical protein